MKYQFGQQQQNAMSMLYLLIALNIIGMIISEIPSLFSLFALSSESLRHHQYWRLLSYAFLHGGFLHIVFNMWGLYIFGSFITSTLKGVQIINLYAVSAVVGGGLWALSNWNSPAICIGASGAVCGFTAAAAMIHPGAYIRLLFIPNPIKLKHFLWVFIGIEILLNFVSFDNIAHIAHVAGALGGYLYIRYLKVYEWDPFGSKSFANNSETINGWHFVDSESGNSQKEIDRLLDKISRSGINSLTDEEYKTLQKARDDFKSKD